MTVGELKNKIEKPEIKSVAVACNTFLRPEFLKKCLDGISKLKIPEDLVVKVLVVDNDKNASALSVVEKVKQEFPFEISYFVEEKRGLANARNRLLREAINLGVSHIAVLDDDDVPDENWLFELVDLYKKQENAYIISGPEYCCFDGEFPSYLTNNNIFIQKTTKQKGEIRKVCSTHNAFFPVDMMTKSDIWFNPDFVFMGGEDGDFFFRASEFGYKIVANPDAIVREINDKGRVNLKWILHRSFYNGYSGSYLKYRDPSQFVKRLLYILKMFVVILLDFVFLPFSIVAGLTFFFNVMALTSKNLGKIVGAIQLTPLNYYKNLNGGVK